MSNVHAFPSPASLAVATATEATPDVEAFHERAFTAYRNRNKSRGLVEAYTAKCVDAVLQLMRWSGKSLVTLTEADYEAWTTYLATDRKLVVSTQRTYQKGVRQVFKFLVKRQDMQNDAYRLFGQRVELVAHSENSIVHVVGDETGGRRPPLTHDQIEHLFASIDSAIDVAEIERPRAVRGLQRDLTVVYTGYVYGLRVSELIELTPDDWRPCPDIPEVGDFGMLQVRYGKGTNGSGKRHRIVPTTHAPFPKFLQWYVAHVRTQYKSDARAHDPLFFNERGGKLSAASVQKAFKRLVIAADLDPTIYSPHTLRRSMCQHEMMRAPAALAQAKAGHKSEATTQGYGQVPLDHVRKHSARLIRAQLQDIKGPKKDG